MGQLYYQAVSGPNSGLKIRPWYLGSLCIFIHFFEKEHGPDSNRIAGEISKHVKFLANSDKISDENDKAKKKNEKIIELMDSLMVLPGLVKSERFRKENR